MQEKSELFVPGEPVMLALGPYQGTAGTFLSLRADPKWADIEETDGHVRSHPLEWMAHAREAYVGVTDRHDEARRAAIEAWEGEGGSAVSRPIIRRRGLR
ncbi:MAG: hypothetical protein HYX27_09835 [Acidobacteria bacterium]|nr:hypothetical protein [Acidobacteriota bacterium]